MHAARTKSKSVLVFLLLSSGMLMDFHGLSEMDGDPSARSTLKKC